MADQIHLVLEHYADGECSYSVVIRAFFEEAKAIAHAAKLQSADDLKAEMREDLMGHLAEWEKAEMPAQPKFPSRLSAKELEAFRQKMIAYGSAWENERRRYLVASYGITDAEADAVWMFSARNAPQYLVESTEIE
jgi:hypothetical protein